MNCGGSGGSASGILTLPSGASGGFGGWAVGLDTDAVCCCCVDQKNDSVVMNALFVDFEEAASCGSESLACGSVVAAFGNGTGCSAAGYPGSSADVTGG